MRSTGVECPTPGAGASRRSCSTLQAKVSVLVELLGLDVEWRALLDRNETLELQRRARLLHSLHPGSDRAGEPLLGKRAFLLAHDFPPMVHEQIGLLQATRGLL